MNHYYLTEKSSITLGIYLTSRSTVWKNDGNPFMNMESEGNYGAVAKLHSKDLSLKLVPFVTISLKKYKAAQREWVNGEEVVTYGNAFVVESLNKLSLQTLPNTHGCDYCLGSCLTPYRSTQKLIFHQRFVCHSQAEMERANEYMARRGDARYVKKSCIPSKVEIPTQIPEGEPVFFTPNLPVISYSDVVSEVDNLTKKMADTSLEGQS